MTGDDLSVNDEATREEVEVAEFIKLLILTHPGLKHSTVTLQEGEYLQQVVEAGWVGRAARSRTTEHLDHIEVSIDREPGTPRFAVRAYHRPHDRRTVTPRDAEAPIDSGDTGPLRSVRQAVTGLMEGAHLAGEQAAAFRDAMTLHSPTPSAHFVVDGSSTPGRLIVDGPIRAGDQIGVGGRTCRDLQRNGGGICDRPEGHPGHHRNEVTGQQWPRDQRCTATHEPTGDRCQRRRGHEGSHRSAEAGGYTWSGPLPAPPLGGPANELAGG